MVDGALWLRQRPGHAGGTAARADRGGAGARRCGGADGEDADGVAAGSGGEPVLRAELVPVAATVPAGRVVAFAGIGRPEKFFRTVARPAR